MHDSHIFTEISESNGTAFDTIVGPSLSYALKCIQDKLNITPEVDEKGAYKELLHTLRSSFGFDSALFSVGEDFSDFGFTTSMEAQRYRALVEPFLEGIRSSPCYEFDTSKHQFDLSSSIDEPYTMIYCPDAMKSNEFRILYHEFDYRSILILPVKFKFRFPLRERIIFNDVNEVAIFNCTKSSAFSESDITLLYTLSNLFFSRAATSVLTKVISTYFDSAVHNSPLGMLIITTDDAVILANNEAVRLLGLTHRICREKRRGEQRKPTFENIEQLFPDAEVNGMYNAIDEIRKHRRNDAKIQFWYRDPKNKRKKLIRVLLYKLIDERGKLGGGGNLDIGIVIDDITSEYEQLQFHKELEIARKVQKSLLPQRHYNDNDIATYGITHPAKEIGGDYYDCIFHKNRLYFAVADVCGKGISAAMVMSSLKTTLENSIEMDLTFDAIITYINRVLYKNTPSTMFITMFLGQIDLKTRTLKYCNCGHHYPIFLRNDTDPFPLVTGRSVLGAFADDTLETGKIRLRKNDMILCYTDGIIESRNIDGEMFEEDRLFDCFRSLKDLSPEEVVRGIIDRVHVFRGTAPQNDDLTVFALKVNHHTTG
jgi:PAS domain-containing protein